MVGFTATMPSRSTLSSLCGVARLVSALQGRYDGGGLGEATGARGSCAVRSEWLREDLEGIVLLITRGCAGRWEQCKGPIKGRSLAAARIQVV